MGVGAEVSSTTRPVRVGLDAFHTPEDVATACVATLGDLRDVRVWEPHAGGGAFVRALARTGALVVASDLDPAAGWPVSDFLADDATEAEFVVGNPPFNDAEAHVRHAIARARYGVGFLLRLAFLESMKRRAFWAEHRAAEVYVLSRRPSFTGGKTDSDAYGWFVWKRWHVGETVLRHLEGA